MELSKRPIRVWAAVAVLAVVMALVTRSHERVVPTTRHVAIRVSAGDVTLRAVRAGQGPAVIFLHGYGESLVAWRGVFDAVARRADAVALDLPGFGLSDKPLGRYDIESFSRRIISAMDALHIDAAVLVGHSLGGAIALATADADPHRVRALVLIAPAVNAAAWDFVPPAGASLSQDWLRSTVAGYELARTRFTAPHDPDWLGESAEALAYTPSADSAYRDALEAVLRDFDFGYLTPERAATIRVPTLLVWGEFDQVVPLEVGRIAARVLPDARLEVLARSLHRPHIERPAETAALIGRFLDGLTEAGPAPAP